MWNWIITVYQRKRVPSDVELHVYWFQTNLPSKNPSTPWTLEHMDGFPVWLWMVRTYKRKLSKLASVGSDGLSSRGIVLSKRPTTIGWSVGVNHVQLSSLWESYDSPYFSVVQTTHGETGASDSLEFVHGSKRYSIHWSQHERLAVLLRCKQYLVLARRIRYIYQTWCVTSEMTEKREAALLDWTNHWLERQPLFASRAIPRASRKEWRSFEKMNATHNHESPLMAPLALVTLFLV